MKLLIDNELNSTDKLLKPDLTQKNGRELLAFYLQTKFKKMLAFDKKSNTPIFVEVKPDFISKFSRRLIDNPQKRLMIGISGASASGKSTICKEIQKTIKSLNMPVSILSTDNYFKDISKLIEKYGNFDNLRDNGYDIDSPDGFQLETLFEDLEQLASGHNVLSPKYLPNGTGVSLPKSILVESQKIVVVEGTATMYKNLKDLFDVKIFVEADNGLRRERFIERAAVERNQDKENAEKHWLYLVEAGKKYIEPTKVYADIILNGAADLIYFNQILEYLHAITNNFHK